MKSMYLILTLVGCALAAPQMPVHSGFQAPPVGQIQFGVDANGCTVGPSGKVCPSGPVQFTSAADGFPDPAAPVNTHTNTVHHVPAQHNFPHHPTFTGLVGPSGVIGPSGLVGPSGPLAFGR